MRVLYITSNYPTESFPYSGIFIYRQVKKLGELGFEIDVIHPTPWVPPGFQKLFEHYSCVPGQEFHEAGPVWHPRFLRPPGRWFGSLEGLSFWCGTRNLAEALCRQRVYSIIHSHWEATAGIIGLYLQEHLKIPHVCSVRGASTWKLNSLPRLDSMLRKKVLSRSDCVVSVNRGSAEFLIREKIRSEVRVIYNGVDGTIFYPLNGGDQGRKDPSKITFLFAGSLEPHKGILDVLTAFRTVATKSKRFSLLVVGDGSWKKKALEQVRFYGIEDQVKVQGFVMPHDMGVIYRQSDILVFPGHGECLPNVIVEAGACGLPTIAYDIPQANEFVIHEETGIRAYPKSPEALSAAMLRMGNDSVFRKNCGQRALACAKKDFDLHQCILQLRDLYETLAASGKTDG